METTKGVTSWGGGGDDVLHIHWDDVLHIHQGFKRVVMRDGPVELGHFL